MAGNHTEPTNPTFPPVYKRERNVDLVDAGPTGEGPYNTPIINLVERTAYLKKRVDETDLNAYSGLLTTGLVQRNGNNAAQAIALRGYIDGLILSNNSGDPNNRIDFSPGVATMGNLLATNPAITVKRLDAVWASGSTNGGLFSGTKAINTWYHCFVMRNNTSGAVDFGFSTSANGNDSPPGWTVRLIGSIRTNPSGNITGFRQVGDLFVWQTPVVDVSVSTLGTTATLYSLSTPIGVRVFPQLNFGTNNPTNDTNVLVTSPESLDVDPGANLYTATYRNAITDAQLVGYGTQILTNLSSQIRARSSLAGTTFVVVTFGWIDQRGRDL